MILTTHIRSVRDSRAMLRSAQARLEAVWRDPIAHHVVEECWTPLLMDVEHLEAHLVQVDTAIGAPLGQLRDLDRLPN